MKLADFQLKLIAMRVGCTVAVGGLGEWIWKWNN